MLRNVLLISSLIFLPLTNAGYKVTDGKIETCKNPDTSLDLSEHFSEGTKNNNVFRSSVHQPPLENPTQHRVARVHFYYPLEESLKVLNQVVYDKTLYGTNDGSFYFEQSSEDIQMNVHPSLRAMNVTYEVVRTIPITLYKVIEECENPTNEPIICTIHGFDLTYDLWKFIHDGFTFTTHQTLKPVDVTIQHNSHEMKLQWLYTNETIGPFSTQHTWIQDSLSIEVPPLSTYRFVVDVEHEMVTGILILRAHVGSDNQDDFKWLIRTCAAPAKDERKACRWIEQGYFHIKDVALTLSADDRLDLCGSRNPRLCRLQVDESGRLLALATAFFDIGFPAELRTTVFDATNSSNIVELPDVEPWVHTAPADREIEKP